MDTKDKRLIPLLLSAKEILVLKNRLGLSTEAFNDAVVKEGYYLTEKEDWGEVAVVNELYNRFTDIINEENDI